MFVAAPAIAIFACVSARGCHCFSLYALYFTTVRLPLDIDSHDDVIVVLTKQGVIAVHVGDDTPQHALLLRFETLHIAEPS